MKKLITLLLALAMVLSLAACGSKDTPAPDGQNSVPLAMRSISLPLLQTSSRRRSRS